MSIHCVVSPPGFLSPLISTLWFCARSYESRRPAHARTCESPHPRTKEKHFALLVTSADCHEREREREGGREKERRERSGFPISLHLAQSRWIHVRACVAPDTHTHICPLLLPHISWHTQGVKIIAWSTDHHHQSPQAN